MKLKSSAFKGNLLNSLKKNLPIQKVDLESDLHPVFVWNIWTMAEELTQSCDITYSIMRINFKL